MVVLCCCGAGQDAPSPQYVNGVVQKLAQQVADSNKLLNSEPLQDAEQISHIAFAFMVRCGFPQFTGGSPGAQNALELGVIV